MQRRRCHTAMHRSLQQRMRNGAPDGTQTHSIRRVGVGREAHLRDRRRRRAHRHARRLQMAAQTPITLSVVEFKPPFVRAANDDVSPSSWARAKHG